MRPVLSALVTLLPALLLRLEIIRRLKRRVYRSVILYGLAGVAALAGFFYLLALLDRLLTRGSNPVAAAGIMTAGLLLVAVLLIGAERFIVLRGRARQDRASRADSALAAAGVLAAAVAKPEKSERSRATSAAAAALAHQAGVNARTAIRKAAVPAGAAALVLGLAVALWPRPILRATSALIRGRTAPSSKTKQGKPEQR